MLLRSGGGGAVASAYAHRHSFIAHALWRSVINAEYRLTYNAAWMASVGAMRGNSRLDQQSVDDVMRKVCLDAEASMPYWTGGRTAADVTARERADAVAEYTRLKPMLEAMSGAAKPQATVTAPSGIRKLNL